MGRARANRRRRAPKRSQIQSTRLMALTSSSRNLAECPVAKRRGVQTLIIAHAAAVVATSPAIREGFDDRPVGTYKVRSQCVAPALDEGPLQWGPCEPGQGGNTAAISLC